jgi:hypothetical protein
MLAEMISDPTMIFGTKVALLSGKWKKILNGRR